MSRQEIRFGKGRAGEDRRGRKPRRVVTTTELRQYIADWYPTAQEAKAVAMVVLRRPRELFKPLDHANTMHYREPRNGEREP